MSEEYIKKHQMMVSTENRYLCFSLGNEHFSIPLLQVKEVIGIPDFTQIPYTPNYFCGIMNLRGKIISVIDMRKKLNIVSKGTEENSVIVCDLENITMGALVDSVDNVINIEKEKILPKPNMQSSIKNDYIDGLIEFKNQIIVLINLAKSLSIEDLIHIEKSGS
ncbi:chemotaxis protein CheW [Fluviispira multicolorata]|uniref:Chemotaxis protein CheW n=1 Tax=Fluviispira multicolorata TaxID=2654512 RepID=A0A833N6E3_9BACT|nr:chemotaxis protein CheW [Fluviispira multicolorata]KAB8029928.1 chemotaxis protein CheW [Fluviispira multicolorata]